MSNMTCQQCDEDIERNGNDVWIHTDGDPENGHDAQATIRDYDAEEQYQDVLDEIYEPVNVCGYDYDAGRALRQLDPIAFRTGMLDYFDGEGIEIV